VAVQVSAALSLDALVPAPLGAMAKVVAAVTSPRLLPKTSKPTAV
jgi:hypothetical protein